MGKIIRLAVCLFLLLPLACSGDKPARTAAASNKATASGTAARSKPFQASVLREPFHRATCQWATKIDTGNLVGYDTREQAIADGHRACKVCKP